MALSDKQKLELLFLRVAALEKAVEDLTGAYSGLMLNQVDAGTTDQAIKDEADKIKPKRGF